MSIENFRVPAIGAAFIAVFMSANIANAQDVSVNYDRLSSLEEPIAIGIGNVTVELTGVIDIPVEFEIDANPSGDEIDIGAIGNFQVSAQTQLSNRWTVGATYFGQYDQDDDEYTDNVAGFVGTSWGTFTGGNLSGLVREETRRQRGFGNASLAFDDFHGGLDNWGGGYVGRFGPVTLSGVVDENGDFELGAEFQRPIGTKDIRFTSRFADGRVQSSDGLTTFETTGVSGVAEFTYGASVFDLGGGYEKLSALGATAEADRWFLSTGARTRINQFSLSAEAHYGQTGGDSEKSAALGASYDIARGLTLNLGINYREADINIGGINLETTDEIKGIFSLRYSF